MRPVRVARAFFPKRQRGRIEWLSQQEPATIGWQITHWSQSSLAQAAVEQAYVEHIHPTTVGDTRSVHEADLHPGRFRWWKTTIWDDEAVARALKILWYYECSESLWHKREVLLAQDEKPNLQVLERAWPKQPMRPGQVER